MTRFLWLPSSFRLQSGLYLGCFWEIFINVTENLGFSGPFSFRRKQDEIEGADIFLDESDACLNGGNQAGQLGLGGRADACRGEAYRGDRDDDRLN